MATSNAYLDAYRQSSTYGSGAPGLATQAPIAAKNPQPKKGNFITRNLDTAGGIGGGLAGAAAGTAILPGIGTLIGGVIGATAGGAAGKAGSETLQGESLNGGDIARSASINGAGELVGAGVGAAGAKLLPKILSKGAAPITDALASGSAKNVTKGIASELPTNAIKTQGDLNRIGDAGNLAANIGLYSSKARGKAAQIVTGNMGTSNANGLVNGIKQTILDKAGNVPILQGLQESTIQAMTENGVAGAADKKAISDAVQAQIRKAVGTQGAIGSMEIPASKAFQAQQAIEKLAAKARTAGKTEIAGSYQDVAKSIGTQIDDHAGANTAVRAYRVSPELERQVTNRSIATLGKGKGTRLAQYIVDSVNAAKSVPDLRAIEAKFIPGAQAATQSAIKGAQGSGNLIGDVAGASVSQYGKLGLAKLIGQKVSTTSGAIEGGLARLTGRVEPLIGPTATRATGQDIAHTALAATPALADTTTQPTDVPTAAEAAQGTPIGATPVNPIDESLNTASDSGYSRTNLIQDIRRDPKNAANYISVYKELNPDTSATSSGTGKITAQQAGLAQSGLQSLGSLVQAISENPGVVSKTAIPGQNAPVIGAAVRNVAGTGDYQAYANNVLDALARLRTGAAMSNAERANYERLLPQAGDSPATIQTKLQQLESAFAPFQTNQ